MYKKGFNYMGSKFRLMPQIKPFFPRNIGTFYDLFGGSGTVSMNIKAKKYVVNDLSNHVYNLYNMFKTKSADEIISYCYEMRDKFGFSADETVKTKIAELNKKPYEICRNYMNENPSALGYYFLTFYSFCNQFRFNKGKFNMPVGNGYFKKECEKPIKDMCKFFSQENVEIYNLSYTSFKDFDEDCFVYMDLPYSNTDAVYNENRELEGWTEKNDYEFFQYCEDLNRRGIKFAISNVFCNKDVKNEHLVEWCEKNNWEVHHLNMTYATHWHTFDDYVSNTDEVLICNYKLENSIFLF